MSDCKCDRKGPENAQSCGKARIEPRVIGGRMQVVLVACDCRCHWAAHRDDCEGGEDCICQRSPRADLRAAKEPTP